MKSKQLKKTKKIKYKKRKTIRKKQKGRGSTSSKLNISNDYSSNPVLPDIEKNKSNIDSIVLEHAENNPNDLSHIVAELKDEITFLPNNIISKISNNKKLIPYKKKYPAQYKLAEEGKSNTKFISVGQENIEVPDNFDMLSSDSKEEPPSFGGKKKKGK